MASNVQEEKVLKDDRKRSVVSADFKVGDQILCYEPDTTKAKMLYEAKVIELNFGSASSKVTQYLGRYFGYVPFHEIWGLPL